jgi:hypothetical protein
MVKRCKPTLMLIAVLAAIMASSSPLARGSRSGHGHHVRSGVYLAPLFASRPFFPTPYYPYPYAYYGPAASAYPAAPATAQQGAPAAAPAQSSVFPRYCPGMNAWYPDVAVCPGGWQEIQPGPAHD